MDIVIGRPKTRDCAFKFPTARVQISGHCLNHHTICWPHHASYSYTNVDQYLRLLRSFCGHKQKDPQEAYGNDFLTASS